MRKAMREVENLLRAKMDCIWVQTYEEREFIEDMKELLGSTASFSSMQLMQWSLTEGVTKLHLANTSAVKNEPPDKKFAEFPALLSLIRKEATGDEGKSNVWLLRDMDVSLKETKCWRAIRDMAEYRSQRYNPIVIISPVINIPDQVSRLFNVVEYDLPNKEEIREMVTASNRKVADIANMRKDASYITLDDKGEEMAVNALNGLTRKEMEMVLRKSIVSFHHIDNEYLSKSKIETVKKTGVLDYRIPQLGFDDIGGNAVIKEWLREAIEAFDDRAAEFGLDKPKGYMAVGIPGSGY